MFTGIIEETGTIGTIHKGLRSIRLQIRASRIMDDLHPGDSIAVNGVCLTADEVLPHGFIADVMPETMQRTGFKTLSPGTTVNLERAMAAGGRFGGHMVSGHIDDVGSIISRTVDDNAILLQIMLPEALAVLTVQKGSITIDGVSLTIAALSDATVTVSLIPHTAMATTLHQKKPGDLVNIECDLIGKYIQRFLAASPPGKVQSKITTNFLHNNGF